MSAFKTWLYAFHSVKGPFAFMLGPLSRKLTGTEISGRFKEGFYTVGNLICTGVTGAYAFFYAQNAPAVLTAYCVFYACGNSVKQTLEKMSSQTTPSFSGYVLRFILIFALAVAFLWTFFWLFKKYVGYHPWYMLLIGLGVLLLSLFFIKIGDKTGSKVTRGANFLGIIGAVVSAIFGYFILLLVIVSLELLPLFGIVWAGSFFMESLKDHVMYWPNFWGSF